MIMHWKHDERHGCFADSPSMLVAAQYFLSRWLQDKDSFCSLCAEAARKALDKESPLPKYMLQEKGERPMGPDDIMVKVFETIHKAALDAGRVSITEPRSPMIDVSDWNVEVQVVKD